MAVKHMPMSSLIIGIDLAPIRSIKGCKTLVGDITTQKSRQVSFLRTWSRLSGFVCLLH